MWRFGSIDIARFGRVWIGEKDAFLSAILLGGEEEDFLHTFQGHSWAHDPESAVVMDTGVQLQEYFEGRRQNFAVRINWHQMTAFQELALRRTRQIPFGEVMTYGEVATAIGRPLSAARAVGRAMATNPIPIVIPCHRVVGSKGELTGYGGPGGLETKAWLLELERYIVPEQIRLPW